jgi:hypothetical protein
LVLVILQLQIIQVEHHNQQIKKEKLLKQMVVVYISHQLTKKVTLELVIYLRLNRQQVLQLLMQTHLTFLV